MLILIVNVVYVLIAIAMVALILMQRGAGAQAGSGFGAGASATVFGSRGASNFLSKSTKWLAISFFAISLGMAWYATHRATTQGPVQQDLGLMAQQQPAAPATTAPAGDEGVPAAPATTPAAPEPGANADDSTVPAAPAATPPQEQAPSGD